MVEYQEEMDRDMGCNGEVVIVVDHMVGEVEMAEFR
jgi:hypothetical protein